MRALRSTLFKICCIINICLPASQAHGAYCSASGGCYEYIYAVQVGTINNTSAVCSGYADYTSSYSTLMETGTGYPISIVTAIGDLPYAGYDGDQCGIWIDWNQDGDFYDLNETVYTASGVGLFTTTITPPEDAAEGDTRMRVRLMWKGTLSPCGYVSYGEVEDYTITVQSPDPYCSASGGCSGSVAGSLNINSVEVGDISNTGTGCSGGYANYTSMSTTMEIGTGYAITVINGDPYDEDDQCGIWVDWNQDFDFDDVGETIPVGGGTVVFTATITPPEGAATGDTRMRIRIRWMGTLNPCGTTDWGEVEDYTITTIPAGPKTRIYGRKWHDLNDNGEMDAGEPALSGWTIFLDKDRDGEIDPNDIVTITNSQGDYELTDLEPNLYYYVSELNQPGWINTYPGAGGMHQRIWVEEDDEVELNFGNYQLHNCDISGYKFHDVNNNGVWDTGEGPLSGWGIYIDENENGQWDSGEPKTTTNTSGYYKFTNLEPGYYNIMEVPQAGWFQTYPGLTSGRLWGLEGQGSEPSTIAEVNLVNMTIENRFAAPYNSSIIGVGALAAGPSTLLYCPLKYISSEAADSLFFEIDCETGLVLHEGILDMPENEIAWTCTWHKGILYVISVEIPLPPSGEPWVTYLNRYDATSKELLSRDSLVDGGGDGIAGDPYENLLLSNLAIQWTVYEINPDTASVIKAIKQEFPILTSMAYTQGVLYKIFWAKDDIYTVHRYDGSVISSEKIADYIGFDTITGGIGVKGGHRVWIGKRDVEANFGNRIDSEGSLSGTKYEDLNGNGKRDANEPGIENWPIYIDIDGDARQDATEPSTVTDSNGNWMIDGLAYGQYFVREAQQQGYTCTEPALGWFNHIEVNQPRDIVFDDVRNLLYVSTEAGTIERYDLSTNQLLTPIIVGGSPHGMDITADYSALYVADIELSDGNRVVHKVHLNTLNVTNLTCPVSEDVDGSYDVAIGSEGIALVTASYGGTSSVPLYVLDTSTDTITVRPDVLGESTISDEVRLVRSYDRTTIWLVNDSSYGWIGVYDAPSDTFTAEKQFNEYLYESPVKLNYNGSMGAVQLDGHCRIVDSDFNMVMRLDDSRMGAEFDPSSSLFYQFHHGWNTLFAVDTIVWEIPDYGNTGLTRAIYQQFVNGETAITADGRVLAITAPECVVLHRREYCKPVLPGRITSGINFGNKTVLCGDIDCDKDVDLFDLNYLAEDWLCNELSMDIAPTVRDYIVSMPDFARLANAWQSQKGESNWDAQCDIVPAGGDDRVDIKDLQVLTDEWLLEGMIYDSDVAGTNGPDGFVNLRDFACLAGNWGAADNIIEYDEDFETGDFNNLPWEHSGDGPWTIDSTEHFEGSYSAKSADLSRYDESILSVTVDCSEGNLYFMLKTTSNGELRFYLDGEWIAEWEGNDGQIDWSLIMIPITEGSHTFEWYYRNEGYGDNHAWIDAIRFPSANN